MISKEGKNKMNRRSASNLVPRTEEELIETLKAAIDAVNLCSEELSKQDIFVYIRPASRASNQGDRIELYDIVLHRSLFDKEITTKGKTSR